MKYLLDTNVVSELRKRDRANQFVTTWFRERKPEELFLSVLTQIKRYGGQLGYRDSRIGEKSW